MINNVLITGSQGYIGTNLCDYIRKNSEVNIYHADKSTGTPVEFLDYLQNVDFVVHLAAYPGVKNCNENFDAAIVDNLCSAFTVFRTAQKAQVPVIFTSSQAAKEPFNNLYASLKGAIEIEARRCNSVGGDIRIIRLSNVYGGQGYMKRKFTVIRNFLKAQKDGDMVINGDGSQIRDFIHVKDVSKAIFKYMMLDHGWNYPIETDGSDDVFLWRVMNCWGWATWADRWCYYEKNSDKTLNEFSKDDIKSFNLDGAADFFSQVLANKKGEMNTWAIFWSATI